MIPGTGEIERNSWKEWIPKCGLCKFVNPTDRSKVLFISPLFMETTVWLENDRIKLKINIRRTIWKWLSKNIIDVPVGFFKHW